MKALLPRLAIDPYIASILGMVALATALPVHGRATAVAGDASMAVIALMFFLQGARLEPGPPWRVRGIGGCTPCLASTFCCSRRWA